MKSSKGLITRILRTNACRIHTMHCPCTSTTRFSSTAQSAEASYEISSSDLSSYVERHAYASRRIPQHVIGKGQESVHSESLPWGSLCLAAAGVLAAAQSLDSTKGNQVVSTVGGGVATANQASASKSVQELPVRRYAVADAVEHASPWVVNVVASMNHEYAKGFDAKTHMGSGFVVSEDGLVVTNAHVVEGCLNGAVAVNFTGGEQLQGKVHAMDRRFDLALVKVNVPPGCRLPVADIGRSLNLRAGEFVVAMGSPKGLANTCTLGIISTTARPRSDLVEDEQTAKITSDSSDFIQTDAAVATGNSGGPLIDLDGRVVGINTLKLSNTEGVGFAIPIDTAWQVIEALRTRGRVDRPHLGMRMVTADTQRSNGTNGGVMILNVTPGGPADRAGLRLGDLITEFDGKEVATTTEILQLVGHQVGREIGMTIQRGGGKLRVTVVTESDVKLQGGDDKKPRAPKTSGTGKSEQFNLDKGDPGTFTISAAT